MIRKKFLGNSETVSIGADVTSGGRLFQRWPLAIRNEQSPTVEGRVCRITSWRWRLKAVVIGVSNMLDVVQKIRWCQTMQAW